MPFLPPNQQRQSTEGNFWSARAYCFYPLVMQLVYFFCFWFPRRLSWLSVSFRMSVHISYRITLFCTLEPATGVCGMHRSVRTRAGSLHMKTTSTTFQLTRENGDLKSATATMTPGATATSAAADVRKMDEFDIKILQQQRHEAEVKR